MKTCLHRQSWTKYGEQCKEMKQNWTGLGNFDNCFCLIFNWYYDSPTSQEKAGH